MSWFAEYLWAPAALADHAAALIVAAPLIAAAAVAMAPNGRFAWVMTLATAGFCFWMALSLAGDIGRDGLVSYALGGWAPPMGIEFRADALNAMILLLIGAIAVLACIFSLPAVEREVRAEKRPLFYSAFLICLAGLLGMTITGDAFNLFVFLEISSISTYVLVALGASRDRRALPSAFNYLIMGTIGATFFVIGVGFLYAATGTLNMADIAARIAVMEENRAVHAGFAFIVVGLGLKAAMYPLHQWLPGAYAYAPSFVTVFLSATATKAAFYALVRFLFSVFNPQTFPFAETLLVWVLAPLAGIAIVACSFQAAFQTDVRRILAYSSVAQVGYMLLGVSTGTALGLSAGMFHLLNHSLMKGALFMAIGGAALYAPCAKLTDLAGAGKKAPWTMSAFAVAGLSLIGFPLTAGFLSKWRLLEASLDVGWIWAVAIIGLASVLAAIYVGRVLEAAFFREAPEGGPDIREAPLLVLAPLWTLAIMNIWFGIDSSLPLGLAQAGADAVFSGVYALTVSAP